MSRATQENIQRLLELTGTTHERLGEIAGLSRSAVSQWVIGNSEPRMGPLQRIADYFGLTTENLADMDGMRYVHMGSDGRLHEDLPRKLREMRSKIDRMEAESIDPKVVMAYESALASMSELGHVSEEEGELLRIFRSLDREGRNMAMRTVTAYSRSGMFDGRGGDGKK